MTRVPVLALAALMLTMTACAGSTGQSAGGPPAPGEVWTLAKAEGWREDLAVDAFAVLEVAYDATTAQAMWDASVPADLPARDGTPAQEGQYGDLSDVDFTEQAVALWSSGESGICPGWASGIGMSADGEVVITRDEDLGDGDGCTDDYNPYRTFVVVNRSDLPEPEALASAMGTVDGPVQLEAVISSFPLS